MNLLHKSSHLVQESTYDTSMSCNFMKYLLKSICSENKKYQINSTAAKIRIFKGFILTGIKIICQNIPKLVMLFSIHD